MAGFRLVEVVVVNKILPKKPAVAHSILTRRFPPSRVKNPKLKLGKTAWRIDVTGKRAFRPHSSDIDQGFWAAQRNT
jgi:hypothetical protein